MDAHYDKKYVKFDKTQVRHNKVSLFIFYYWISLIRPFDFRVFIFAHSIFEHLFLPIRVSDFWKSFTVKNFFVSKMQSSCTLTRTNKIV
jgi:hypothetical protein